MLPSIGQIRNALPPFRGEKNVLAIDQNNDDIIAEILKKHRKYETDYDKIYPFFDTGNIETTCRGLWEFLKYNLVYDAEPEETQSVKGPSGILHPGEQIDCKHYSLFAGGVLDAIKQNEDEPWDWCYRFVSYDSKPVAKHVFVVVKPANKEIWVDPVLPAFNQKDRYTFFTDETPMALYEINGVPKGNSSLGAVTQNTAIFPDVTVHSDVAWTSFLTMVNENMFGLKTMLKRNPVVVNTQVKAYCQRNGFDYDQLQRFINA